VPEFRALSLSALVVHLWLSLFSVCVGLLRVLDHLRAAVGWTQWLVKNGRQHPFDAIRYVAAAAIIICIAGFNSHPKAVTRPAFFSDRSFLRHHPYAIPVITRGVIYEVLATLDICGRQLVPGIAGERLLELGDGV
jgi:hypothetical protein